MGVPNEGGAKAPEVAKAGPAQAPAAPTTAPAGVAGTGSVSASAVGQSREVNAFGEGQPGAPAGSGTDDPGVAQRTPADDAAATDGQGTSAVDDAAAGGLEAIAKDVVAAFRAAAEAYLAKVQRASKEPKAEDSEAAILMAFDALPLASRKALLLGTPDTKGLNLLARIATLMNAKLKEMDEKQGKDRGGAAQKLRSAVPNMGQRTRETQARLFFDKVLSTGGRTEFWSEEPIYVDRKTGEVVDGPDQGRQLSRREWRHPKHVGIRIDRALKYSSLPGLSRHHWGTDVDIQSVESKDWQAGGEGKPEGKYYKLSLWMEANRDTLPLKTTYSGDRSGGYLDEEWHVSMRELGPGVHQRYNALISRAEMEASIHEAFKLWAEERLPADADLKETTEALSGKLDKMKLESYVDGVNPDIAPGHDH
jgi:hypothetical protein